MIIYNTQLQKWSFSKLVFIWTTTVLGCNILQVFMLLCPYLVLPYFLLADTPHPWYGKLSCHDLILAFIANVWAKFSKLHSHMKYKTFCPPLCLPLSRSHTLYMQTHTDTLNYTVLKKETFKSWLFCITYTPKWHISNLLITG